MFRRISVFTSSGSQVSQAECKRGVSVDSLHIHHSITAQLSGRNDCDVTRRDGSDGTRQEQIFISSVFHAVNSRY